MGGTRYRGRRSLFVAVILVLCVPLVAGAAFNFGISPSKEEAGLQEPGDRFFVSFFVVTDSEEEEATVEVDTADGTISEFASSRPEEATNFSEQRCIDCIDFMKGDGPLNDHSGGGNVKQWKAVEFFVNVPENAEPGYHMLKVQPQPRRESGGGGVGVASTASFPVLFQVPGEAIRSGRIIGMHAGRNAGGQQQVAATFYNDGTVTMTVSGEITVETVDGNETVRTGTRRVGPKRSVDLTATVDADLLERGEPFMVYASVDYTTGEAAFRSSLTPSEPVTVQGATVKRPQQDDTSLLMYIAVSIMMLVSTVVTWKVIDRARF